METIRMKEDSSVIHRTHRDKRDFDRHGSTDQYPGCSTLLRGMIAQPHSNACRQRVDQRMEQEAQGDHLQEVLENRKRNRDSDDQTQ